MFNKPTSDFYKIVKTSFYVGHYFDICGQFVLDIYGFIISFLVYDPDPISSMRKRRISADSIDSGSASGREMHPQTAHDLSKLVSI
jgi:hypothetical protein